VVKEKRSEILRRGLERLSPELRAHFAICERCSGEGNLWHLPEFAGKIKEAVKGYPHPDRCTNCEGMGLKVRWDCYSTVGDILCARVIYEMGMLKLTKHRKSVG
jgi:hypothetical protein